MISNLEPRKECDAMEEEKESVGEFNKDLDIIDDGVDEIVLWS